MHIHTVLGEGAAREDGGVRKRHNDANVPQVHTHMHNPAFNKSPRVVHWHVIELTVQCIAHLATAHVHRPMRLVTRELLRREICS